MGTSQSMNPMAEGWPESTWDVSQWESGVAAEDATQSLTGTFVWNGNEMKYRHLKRRNPEGILFAFHGMAVSTYHVGGFVSALSHRCNVDVFGMDQYGHGMSPGRRLDVPSRAHLIDAQCSFVRAMIAEHNAEKRLPVFVWGESMGGATAFYVAHTLGPEVLSGCIMMCPALEIPDLPNKCQRGMLRSMRYISPTAKAADQRYDALTRDPAKLERLLVEPFKINGPITLRTGLTLVDMAFDAADHYATFNVPFLICHGSADRYTDPEGGRKLMVAAQVDEENRAMIEYEGAFHDLVFELDETAEKHENDVVLWLQENIERAVAEANKRE